MYPQNITSSANKYTNFISLDELNIILNATTHTSDRNKNPPIIIICLLFINLEKYIKIPKISILFTKAVISIVSSTLFAITIIGEIVTPIKKLVKIVIANLVLSLFVINNPKRNTK